MNKTDFLKYYTSDILIPLSILAITIFTHVSSLIFTPPWYSDEGWTVALIQNLIMGKSEVFSMVYFWIPHAPVSYYLSIPFFIMITDPMVALRVFSAVAGILTTIAIFYLGKAIHSRNLGLLSSILYAVYYPAVLYYHIGFIDYNWSALFMSITAIYLVRFLKAPKKVDKGYTKFNEIGFIIFMSLSVLTHYYTAMFGIAIFVSFLLFKRNLAKIIFGDLSIAALPVIVLFSGLYVLYGNTFIEHFGFNFLRLAQYGGERYLINMINYLCSYWWNLVAFASLIVIIINKRGFVRQIFTTFLITLLLMFQFTYIVTGGSYAVAYSYPLLIVSLGYLLIQLFTYMYRRSYGILYLQLNRNIDLLRLFRGFGFIILMTVIALAFGVTGAGTMVEANYGMTNPYPSYLNQYQYQMTVVSEWLNNNTTPDDLVIGSPHYLFMLDCKASDYPYAVAFNGGMFYRPPVLPGDTDVVFSAKYTDAKYCVIDPFVTQWFTKQPGSEFIGDIIYNWTQVYGVYDYIIYENPNT